jgi:uncharacterized repeat protein (TIGR02543 family)
MRKGAWRNMKNVLKRLTACLIVAAMFLSVRAIFTANVSVQADSEYTFYLVLDGNGSTSGSMSKKWGYVGGRSQFPANVYKRTGYSFAGWNTEADGSGQDFADKSIFIFNSNKDKDTFTVYAQWTPIQYTIKFDGNGSTSGSTSSMKNLKYDTSYALTANSFKRKGYSFAGWSTKADGSGKIYDDEKKVKNLSSKDGDSITLYAQWTTNIYHVLFFGNGSTSGTESDMDMYDLEYGTSYTLNANIFKRTGYTFAGWNTEEDGSGKSYKNKAKVKNLSSKFDDIVNLYAQWTPNKYTIAFDGNGSTSGSMSSMKDCKYASSYKLSKNEFKKNGYTFAGWNTKKDGSGKSYSNAASVKKLTSKNKGKVTLYAQWTKSQYSITYVLNGGTNSKNNPSTYTSGKAVTLKDPTRDGYTFLGWYTDKKLTQKITKISASSSGNLTLYASWKAKKTSTDCTTCNGKGTVKCKECGGSGSTETKCDTCHGLGYTTVSGQGAESCSACGGIGTIKKKCTTCKGKGEVTCSTCGGSGTKD